MDLGTQIKQRRVELGMTQAELASLCEIDIRTIQRIETAKVHPRLYTQRKLNEVLQSDFAFQEKKGDKPFLKTHSFWLWLTIGLSLVFVVLFFPIARKTNDTLVALFYTVIGLWFIWLVFIVRVWIFTGYAKRKNSE